MSRPKKETLSAEEQEWRRKSRERIRAYLDENGYSIHKAAFMQKLPVTEGAIRGYLKGDYYISNTKALLFERYTGIIYEYWKGWVDYKTPEEREEAKEKIVDDAAEWRVSDSTLAEQHRIDLQNKAFFARFGFNYENLSFSPGPSEFAGMDNPSQEVKTFQLTSVSSPDLSACFTETELRQIFDRLKDTLHGLIELECYRKTAAQHK